LLIKIEEGKIKSERLGSDSGDWKKKYFVEKKEYELLVELRQVMSCFEKKPERKIMDGLKKEV